MTPLAVRRLKLLLVAALTVYGGVLVAHPERYGWIDSLDLAIHESGHLVFGPFGEAVGFLGGTLLQLLVPAAFAFYFHRRGDRYAASVVLWWVAQSCWNVSVYAADARAQELPLVGGGEHDWAYLLGRTGLLEQDQLIAGLLRVAGGLLFAWAMLRAYTAATQAPAAADAPPPADAG